MVKNRIFYFDDEIKESDNLPESRLVYIKKYIESIQGIDLTIEDYLENAEKLLSENKFDLLIVDIRIALEFCNNLEQYESTNWTRTGIKLIERVRSGFFENNGIGTKRQVPIISVTGVADPSSLSDLDRAAKTAKGFTKECFFVRIAKPPKLANIGDSIVLALQQETSENTIYGN